MFNDSVAHTKASLYDIFYATKAKKTYTYLGISLILIVVFLLFALVPTITTIGTVQQKITSYQSLNADLKVKITNARKLDTQLNSSSASSADGLKDEIDFVNKVYMNTNNLKPVYINLYRRAKDNNVSINSISPKYPNTNSGSQTDSFGGAPSSTSYELQISLRGKDLTSALSFIASLESYTNFPIISRIKATSINDLDSSAKLIPNSSAQSQTSKGVSFSVDLIVYLDTSRAVK